MKLFEVTHRISKGEKEIELVHQVISQDWEVALNKAFSCIPKSYQEKVIGFDHKEIRTI